MSEPFLGEVRMVAFNFAPRGWAFCDGQILPINQNQSLYSLLGTTYGGDGRTSFALPDLRGRTPIHVGSADGGMTHALGQKSGEETHTLTVNELAQHSHNVQSSTTRGTASRPSNSFVPAGSAQAIYGSGPAVAMGSTGMTGGSQAHDNMQPYLVLNFCMALQGLFPSRN